MPRRSGVRGPRGNGPHARGGRSGGDGSDPQSRQTTISKATSYVLRHGAAKEGLRLDESGYANVADLLSWRRLASMSVTFAELKSVIDTNAKQRFALIPVPSLDSSSPSSSDSAPVPDPSNPAHYLIRATQGHSIVIASENLLTPILASDADCPDQVVHGTYEAAWKSILKTGGLHPMGRQHVHFTLGVPEGFKPVNQAGNESNGSDPIIDADGTAVDAAPPLSAPIPSPSTANEGAANASPAETAENEKIISGMRANATVLIWVDVKRSLTAGALQWWRSANGVVLTEGDADKLVRLDWVDRAERRNGEMLWTREGR
ncbi:hypothetical protein MMC07_004039 [Pseudocyphellaria aurata]|nr:hypothetical protein [Pseudocyphellaria aurata]